MKKAKQAEWVEKIAGLMTEAWKDIDPIKELAKAREEDWENQQMSKSKKRTDKEKSYPLDSLTSKTY